MTFRFTVAVYFTLFVVGRAGLVISSDGGESEPSPARLSALPLQVPVPEDNPQSPGKIALGRQLFFDPRLSGDNTMSCATCHLPDKAFGDGLPRGIGRNERPLSRNTPTLLNVAFASRLLWDGRAGSLEEQALLPIQSPEEMHQDLDELEDELNSVPGYVEQFQAVFGTPATREGVARAIAAFERTLLTEPSPFDRYLGGDQEALSESAKRGLELFRGDAGCIRCHHGPLLSDGRTYRLGVSFQDDGLATVTGRREDRGKFRTPSLRNVAQTGPYMHDGSLKTLEDVVFFYYRGVPAAASGGLRLDIEPLTGQSFSEIPDLVSFLESLTGPPPRVIAPELP